MITFASDGNEDLAISMGGGTYLISGDDAILQSARQRAKARRGEMIHAKDQGVPFEQVAWIGTPNIAQFEAGVRAAIMTTPGVVEVRALKADLVDGVLQYTATLVTENGTEASING